MTNSTAPTPGVSLFCPLSLPAIERELLTMQHIIKARGQLPSEYAPLFERIESAWEFYRPLQPAGHQLHIDRLIANVYGGTLIDEHC